MRRRITAVLLIFALVVCTASTTFAHDDQNEHDGDLKLALFGDRNKSLSGNELIAFRVIANAAAISIDQFSPNTELKWKKSTYDRIQSDLKALNLSQLDIEFDSIDLNANVSDGKNITANTHRCYTHQGWNYSKYPNPEFWKTRKQVLIDVVNKVLFYPKNSFARLPWLSDILFAPNEQCDAFCGMVYYIHILGDHIEGDDPEKLTDLEPLIQYTNLTTPGIITELQEQLQLVFASQTTSRVFIELQQELANLRIKAEANCGTWGAIDTFEKCTINQEYAKKLLQILGNYIPKLLAKESFFVDRFSSIK